MLRAPQGSVAALGDPFVSVPAVVAGQSDVVPAERRDVSKQRFVDGSAFAKSGGGPLQVHGIPHRDGGDDQIQAAVLMAAEKRVFLAEDAVLGLTSPRG